MVILQISVGTFLRSECAYFNIQTKQVWGTKEDIRIFNTHWNCGFIVWRYCNFTDSLIPNNALFIQ